MTITLTVSNASKNADTIIALVGGDGKLPKAAGFLSDTHEHLFTGKNPVFGGKWGQSLIVPLPKGAAYTRVLLIGVKKDKKATVAEWTALGGKISNALESAQAETAFLPAHDAKVIPADMLARIAEGVKLCGFRFLRHRTVKKDEQKAKFKTLLIDGTKGISAIKESDYIVEGVDLARDLVTETPNYLYPETYAKRIAEELKPLGIQVEIFDDKQLTKMKMGGIIGVGQGSVRPPRMVVMRWKGGKKGDKPLGLVGKGITFDTGGISIKPSNGMEDMKYDMAGSAAVVGAMKAVALNKVKANVTGVVALAENMPSGSAIRPSDILVSYSGKTVEVLNTDAEGRLVLMDALTYIQETDKPKWIVDLATLTGAIVIALGDTFAGAFVNNDAFWNKLNMAAETTGERLWRMPLDETYRKSMEGNITDIKNLSSWDRGAGSCTAAGFLEHFIEGDTPWAHLDIAGMAWNKRNGPWPKGATGYGVRLLYDLIKRYA